MNDTERARLIATLTHLKVPFDRKQISKLPGRGGGPELDYVNHAHVTTRLNAKAEDCTWTVDEEFTRDGVFWIRGTMTICGVSRVEYGKGKDPLVAMSHFVRRAAMRFGVATDLWAKEDFEDSEGPPVPPEAPADRLAASAGAERPGGSEEYGEGSTGSPGEPSGGVEAASVVAADRPPPPDAPHEHVKGKQLASGSWLCSFELAPGRVCGAKFKPAPTVFTEPVAERADIS